MTLHARLHSVDVKNKSALISVDTFHPSGEKTVLWWSMARAGNDPIVFMAQPALDPTDASLTGSADTIEEVLDQLGAFTASQYGAVDMGAPDYLYGLEFI